MFSIVYHDFVGAYTWTWFVPRSNVIRFLHASIPLYSSQKFWALDMPQASFLSTTIAILSWWQEWNCVLPPSAPHGRKWHSPQTNHYALVGSANETNRLPLKNLLSSHEPWKCNIYCRCKCGFQNKNNPKKELSYKNADKASKLVPLQTEKFPTHELLPSLGRPKASYTILRRLNKASSCSVNLPK